MHHLEKFLLNDSVELNKIYIFQVFIIRQLKRK